MNTSQITAVILSFNEQDNISRCLEALQPLQRIVLVDSGSQDRTVEIAKTFRNVEVFVRPFDNFENQWEFGRSKVQTEWTLDMDADYIVPASFWDEVARIDENSKVRGYSASFEYCIYGNAIPAAVYPERVVLYAKSEGAYKMHGHTQWLSIEGKLAPLTCKFLHDDRKDLNRWLLNQLKYARDNVNDPLSRNSIRSLAKRLRPLGFVTPILMLVYCLFGKGLIFAGRPGIYYSCQRMFAELLSCIHVMDRKIARK